jgi:hypothetical protein
MSRTSRSIVALVAIIVTAVGSSACGGSGSATAVGGGSSSSHLPQNAVARVGQTLITRAELNQWMGALAGSDFYTSTLAKAPAGLAVDPPNYPACVAAMRRVASEFTGGPVRLTSAQLTTKCRELDRGIKLQAISQLIDMVWMVGSDAEAGVTVSNQEVDRFRAEHFPTEAALRSYLALRDWNLSDELAQIRTELLSGKLLEKFAKREQALTAFGAESTKKWRARTICRAGYVVSECSEAAGKSEAISEAESPAVIIEQMGHLRKSPKPAPDLECENTPKGVSCHPVGNGHQ